MKSVLKGSIPYLFIFLLTGFTKANCRQGFDKSAYYKVMENGTVDAIDQQIKIVEIFIGIDKEAYTGALLMKKAAVTKGAPQKLSVFKDGHKKLEAAIEKEPENPEWRFLRLLIQEHAPKILNYRNDLKKDAAFIQSNFKKLPSEVQAIVMDYRKHSDTLQPLNF